MKLVISFFSSHFFSSVEYIFIRTRGTLASLQHYMHISTRAYHLSPFHNIVTLAPVGFEPANCEHYTWFVIPQKLPYLGPTTLSPRLVRIKKLGHLHHL